MPALNGKSLRLKAGGGNKTYVPFIAHARHASIDELTALVDNDAPRAAKSAIEVLKQRR